MKKGSLSSLFIHSVILCVVFLSLNFSVAFPLHSSKKGRKKQFGLIIVSYTVRHTILDSISMYRTNGVCAGILVEWRLEMLGDVFCLFLLLCDILTAAALVALNRTSSVDLHFTRCVARRRWWTNAVLNLCRHCHKSLFNIRSIFRRCLEEWNSQLIGVFLQAKNYDIQFWDDENRRQTKKKNLEMLTVAVVVSTTFFVVKSHLLPTSSLFTFSHA